MKKIYLLLSVLSVFALVMPACQTTQQLHTVKGEFIEGQLGDSAQTLNWIIATDDGLSERYASFMVDPLAVFDNQYKLQLRCLAKDIEVSADGLVYTVTIRDDLKWSDGTNLTADDYVYTIKNLMCASWINSMYSTRWMEQVDGADIFVSPEVVNKTTFRIVRKTVNTDFLYSLYGLMPYPKNIAQHYENNEVEFFNAPELDNMTYAGNLGAYIPVSLSKADGFLLKRNPVYYLGQQNGAPYFETYRIKTYALQGMMDEALTNGDITFSYVEPKSVNDIKSKGNIEVYAVPAGYYVFVAYNQRGNGWEGLKDARVRQAVSMVIDKNEIINTMYGGFADPAYSFIAPYSPWYNAEVLGKYGTTAAEDRQKAIELIKSAGYQQQMVDGQMKFVDKQGKPIKLIFPLDMNSDFDQNMAIIIKQNLLGIGLDIDPMFSVREQVFKDVYMNKVPDSDKTPTLNNGKGAVSIQPWDLTILSSSSNPLALQGSEAFFSSSGKYNFFGFQNEQVDALYKRAGSAEAVNTEIKKQIYSELAQVISQEQPVDFLVFYKDNFAIRSNVKGFEPGVNYQHNSQFWYFD